MAVGNMDAGTVDPDLLVKGIHPDAELGDQVPIDLDPAVGDHGLAFTTGTKAGLGEYFLKANAFLRIFMRFGGATVLMRHRSPNVTKPAGLAATGVVFPLSFLKI